MAAEMRVEIRKVFAGRFLLDARFRMALDPPRVLVLFGPSGSGKSTVLRSLAGLESPDHGTIVFGDAIWFDSRAAINVPPQRRCVGYMFQEYALFPTHTVGGNIGYGLDEIPKSERKQRVEMVMAFLGVQGLEHARPAQLSGGQQQRVALGRAIARQPSLLLLDEPLSALDLPTRLALRSDLGHLLRRLSIPSVVVTHDWEEALALGDEMVVLKDGRVRQHGTPQDVFNRPTDVEVAQIVGMETVLPGRVIGPTNELIVVEAGGHKLVAVGTEPQGAEVFVCIRAQDIVLEQGQRRATSARNHLSGRVTDITFMGPLVRVTIDCGFSLCATITRAAVEDLGLRVGGDVTAAIKAGAVHLVPRGDGACRMTMPHHA